MKPDKTALAMLGSIPLIVFSLLTAVIDIAVFQFLYIQPDSLALAHITSFLTASAVGYFSISLWPSHDTGNKPKSNTFRFSHLPTFILIALLVVFLRGGLLASMLNIMQMPALAAISFSAIFSSVSLYAAYFYFQRTSNLSAEFRWSTLCLGVVAYTTLLKLFYLGLPELIFEEAYYWNYAQHLDIGYLDHPLIVAWIIKAFTSLMGDIEFAVRLGAFLCWFVTAYYSYRLTKEIFNQSIAYWALVIVAVLPAYFSFGWFMSPDAPLSACWAAATYYIHQVVVRDDKKAWLGVGIAIGLGMSSKYTIALLGAAIVLYLLFDRNARKWLSRPEPYIALAIAFILFSPVVIWNIQHDWLSFTFQSQGRLSSGHSFSLPRFISNLLIFLTPTGLLTVIAIALFRKKLLSGADKSHAPSLGNLAQSYLLLADAVPGRCFCVTQPVPGE
jgi:dolichol-phosphate mannosyltransferase